MTKQDFLQTGGLCLLCVSILAGCASSVQAPVTDRSTTTTDGTPILGAPAGYYLVKKGDTLYSIALEHGQDYRDVATWNTLGSDWAIKPGQMLRVKPVGAETMPGLAAGAGTGMGAQASPIMGESAVEARPLPGPGGDVAMIKREPKGGKQPYSAQAAKAPTPAAPAVAAAPAVGNGKFRWTWPVSGKPTVDFAASGGKGVEFHGSQGDPVHAAESGKVIYAGSGIRGYGNLLVIQHADGMSSVYAHNSKLMVREGQEVVRGAKIAEMGSSDTDKPKLHFEIRSQGKTDDPAKYLPPR